MLTSPPILFTVVCEGVEILLEGADVRLDSLQPDGHQEELVGEDVAARRASLSAGSRSSASRMSSRVLMGVVIGDSSRSILQRVGVGVEASGWARGAGGSWRMHSRGAKQCASQGCGEMTLYGYARVSVREPEDKNLDL